jgi:2-polyprenyl-3-methyl-5-hydroxy-6-metoxy-1,4-benzoquinol methylase
VNQTRAHRSDTTSEKYKGIPIHAANGLHEVVMTKITGSFDPRQPTLELAAGSGALTQRLIDNGFSVDPVDLSDSGWSVKTIKPVVADFNTSHWNDALHQKEYSQIVAVEVIEHLDNPRQFLRDLYAILKPGGKLIVTTPNPLSAMSIALSLTQERYYVFDRSCYFTTGHVTLIPPWMLACHAEEAGFRVKELRSICQPVFNAWWKRYLHAAWSYIVLACRRSSKMNQQVTLAILEK